MKRMSLVLLFAAAVGCSSRVNLVAVRNSFDSHKAGIQKAETQVAAKESARAEILLHTATPRSAPYPALASQIASMREEVAGMKAVSRKIDAYKPKFDRYRGSRTEVSSDDQAEWNEYQGAISEYQVLMGELNGHAGRFNQASNQFDALLKQHGISKVNIDGLKGEVEAASKDIEEGVTGLETVVPEKKKMLQFAKEAGAGAQLLLDKREVLDQMEALLPELLALKKESESSKKAVLSGIKGKGEVWNGPGMPGQVKDAEKFTALHAKYKEKRGAWDQLAVKFDSIKPPAAATTTAASGVTKVAAP